jgi:predicted metal-dependent hydrolase
MSVSISFDRVGPSATMHFVYGEEKIKFARVPRTPDAERILIKVHPDCRVVVAAPECASDDDVLKAVQKRRRWIHEKLSNFRKQLEHVTTRRYISGESHYYLGKQYQLKVNESSEKIQGVKLLRGKLEVTLRERQADKVKRLLMDWYKARAKEVFATRLDALLGQALWVSDRPQLRIQAMQTQWGSCSPNGRLTLNPYLVKAPRECIDYVILHELCHIAEHNHSERFYRLMSQVMPKWEAIKQRLDQQANLIITE